MSTVNEVVKAYGRARARAQAATDAERQQLTHAAVVLAERGFSVRQIADRLGVPKSSVYRVLVAAQRDQAEDRQVEAPTDPKPTAGSGGSAPGGNPPAGNQRRAPAASAKAAAPRPRAKKKQRWFVVETKPEHRDDLERAVVIMSQHASQAGAVRGRGRLWRRGAPEGVVYVVRSEDQIRRRLEWDPQLRRGVTRDGPPPR